MQTDLFFFGAAPMDDAGNGGPAPTDRRYGNDAFMAAYDNLFSWADTADRLGYDTFWLTEHHFQHEGYEVVPNLILFGTALAMRTERLRMGQMFNIVPQWHPLRLAEDFAVADILTGGRMVFGVGRGTVPREAESLGAMVASGDNEMSKQADARNRELFEEGMEVIKAAWDEERFSFTGKHFQFPPVGVPDRGTEVTDLTLVPRPTQPVEIFQAVTSPATLEYVATVGHRGVFWNQPTDVTARSWARYGEVAEENGRPLRPGEDRTLVLNVHGGRTTGEAVARVRDAHDEYTRFLAPYGRFRSWSDADGALVPFDFQPTVEDARRCRIGAIGSVEEVIDVIGSYIELLDLEHLVLFPDFPGLRREDVDAQMHLVADEVLPALGHPLTP